MGERVKLDPRLITGPLHLDTPLFVIIYIIKFCKKISFKESYYMVDSYFQEKINEINNFEWLEISFPSEESDSSELSKLIKFISPFSSEEWYVENVINGYNHLVSFSITNELIPINKSNLIFGQKTNLSYFKLNELIVFRLLKELNYSFSRSTSLKVAQEFLEMYYSGKIKSLRNSLLHNIQNIDNISLLKIYQYVSNINSIEDDQSEFSISNQSNSTSFDFDNLKMNMIFSEFGDSRKIIPKLLPKTHYEAIIISAIRDDIDISSSSSPLKEYENLKHRNYIPFCSNFSKNYYSNREFYRISKNWSINLSNQLIYSSEQMMNFVLEEGFEITKGMTFSEFHSYMKSTKLTTNFYFGIHPLCLETKTIMLTPLSELHHETIICFGIEEDKVRHDLNFLIKSKQERNINKIINPNSLYYISIEELTEFFRNSKIFINPVNNEPLEARLIKKLKLYCNKMILSKTDNSVKFSDMLSVIGDLEKIRKLLDGRLFQLKIKIEKLNNQEIKENIGLFFTKVMEMGLYMRGWKINGTDKFPLKSEDTTIDKTLVMSRNLIPNPEVYINERGAEIPYVAEQFIIDRTILSLNEAKSVLNELPQDIINDIKFLHTLRFDKLGKPEEMMGMIFRGLYVYHNETLIECMENLFQGMGPDGTCIRINSGWILFSAAWYLMILGYKIPFAIDKIDNIS